jgi:fatty-acyl-CoA synthase
VDFAAFPDSWARTDPDRVAVHCAGVDTTRRRLANRIERATARLAGEWGVKAGDRVAYLGANSPEVLILLFALARLGAILLPLNSRLTPGDWRTILTDCGACLLLADTAFANEARTLQAAAAVPLRPVEALIIEPCAYRPVLQAWPGTTPVLLVYTSGSSGAPKGVLHSQEGLLWNARASIAAHQLTAADHVLSVLPMFHVGGLCIQTIPALLAGARVTIHARFDPARWLADVAQARPTTSLMVPATLKAVIDHPDWARTELSSLRLVMAGSSIIARPLLQAFHRRGIPVGQVYGATETGPVSVVLGAREARDREGMAGWPALHSEIRLTDASGAEIEPQAVGEVRVRGRNVMIGYWGGAAGSGLEDGWFCSGDLGRRDADGCIEIVGRVRELIISGGENIYPAEIENLILEHPAVADVAVVALADPTWGQTPAAAIVLRAASVASADDILSFLTGRLAAFKRPRHICFVDALPRSALGKVLKADLAQSLAVALAHPQLAAGRASGPARGTA